MERVDRTDPGKYAESHGVCMESNLRRRVGSLALPKSRALDSVLEAVVNSIQAMDGRTDGTITVEIDRDTEQRRMVGGGESLAVDGFTITDEGVGFDERNFDSFKQLDTAYKAHLGCKGIGRLLWILVFERAEIDSTYRDGDDLRRRTFTFDRDREVIVSDDVSEPGSRTGSRIHLRRCRPEFKDNVETDHEDLAHAILEHCILYFIHGRAPRIVVRDGGDTTVVNTLFEEHGMGTGGEHGFSIKGHDFKLYIIRNYDRKSEGNHLWLCAYSRTVMGHHSPMSGLRMVDSDGRAFVVDCYLSSEYLDERVNATWSDFGPMSKPNLVSDTTLDDMGKTVVDELRKLFTDELGADRIERQEMMDGILAECPQYRYFVHSHPEMLDRLKMDGEDVRRTNIRMLNNEISNLESQVMFSLEDLRKGEDTFKDYARIEEGFRRLDEVNRNNLCKYMVHRRMILELYADAMRYIPDDDDGRYPREAHLHNLLLPQRTDSGDGYNPYECNLWVLDERLNYFTFYDSYSDSPSKNMADSGTDDRPDIVIFTDGEGRFANNVAIIELKRYGRDKQDLAEQMLRYVEQIRGNHWKKKNGEKLNVRDDAMFFCYGICELSGTEYESWLESRDFTPMDGGTSMYRWYKNLKTHMHIMDMNLILDNAEKRNRIFFDILGMSKNR